MKNSTSITVSAISNDNKSFSYTSFLTYQYLSKFRALLLAMVFVFSLTSCKYDDITVRPLANELVGTTWVAHMGTGTADNLEYLQVLRFTDETKLYFMNYNSNGVILNTPDNYNFVYTSDKIQVSNNNRLFSGSREGNVIRMGAYEYYYLDINGSVSEYLKKNNATLK